MRTALVLRFVLIALGALLGIVLIARGAPVVGGIVLAMAAVRLVMVLSLRRRRRELWARRMQQRGARGNWRPT